MRKITLNFDQESAPNARLALGYLATWALDGYDTVDVFLDGGDDLVAVYKDSASPGKKYVIGAVWREERNEFSFHS
jgi:hypothetical protein